MRVPKRYLLPQVDTPLLDQDIANKKYVDDAATSGLTTVDSVVIVTGTATATVNSAQILDIEVDGEGASADDLLRVLTLAGGVFANGTMMIIHCLSNSRNITIKTNAGGTTEFQLAGQVDFVLNNTFDMWIGIMAGNKIMEISRSNNN